MKYETLGTTDVDGEKFVITATADADSNTFSINLCYPEMVGAHFPEFGIKVPDVDDTLAMERVVTALADRIRDANEMQKVVDSHDHPFYS